MSYDESQNEYATPTGGSTPTLTLWQSVLTSPAVQTFARYRSEAELGRAVLWIVIASLISTLAAGLPTLINPRGQMRETMEMFRETLPPDIARELPPMMPGMGTSTISLGTILCGIPTAVVFGLIGSFISVGLVHLAARLLKGTGTYTETFFLIAAVSAPFAILTGAFQLISGLLRLIPVVGIIAAAIFGLLSFALSIYVLVLNAMAVAAAHRFALGKGFASVLLPPIVIFVVVCCCIAVSFSLLGASLGTIFEEIERELNMLIITFV